MLAKLIVVISLLLAGSVGAQVDTSSIWNPERFYIDTVVCVEGCPDGWEYVPSDDCSYCKQVRDSAGYAYILERRFPTTSCDTLWLPKKQVWLTGEQYERLMRYLGPITLNNGKSIVAPSAIDSVWIQAVRDSIRAAAKQGMFDAWNTPVDSIPKMEKQQDAATNLIEFIQDHAHIHGDTLFWWGEIHWLGDSAQVHNRGGNAIYSVPKDAP